MAAPGAFVIKERLESLEARIETALDEIALKDFSKKVVRDAISETIAEVISEIHEKRGQALVQVESERVDFNTRIKEVRCEFETSIVESSTRLESSMMFSNRMTAFVAFVALATSLVAVFM